LAPIGRRISKIKESTRLSLRDQKSVIREAMRRSLRDLDAQKRSIASVSIRGQIQKSPEWSKARSVLLFHTLAGEPEVDALIEAAVSAGKFVALPRYAADQGGYEAAFITDFSQDCVTGRFGVLEPAGHCPKAELNRLDFALVPGLAFDNAGRRLGRGKGYYDRLLERFRGTKCGVAFDFQVVAELPEEPHDVKLNCLATPTRWMEFSEISRP